MSVIGKIWVVKNNNSEGGTLEKILENRKDINFDDEMGFHDPFLFEDMEKAVSRIEKAVKNQERIIVFGDYDVDGITGTAILVHILRKIGAQVSYRLPNRVEDGYGFSGKFIRDFEENRVKLVITTDCGISNEKHIKEAAEKGIDFIVTDHHTIPEKIPEAVAIIHPKIGNGDYPYKELTGAGVALKVAQALIQRFIKEGEGLFENFIELATLGTIADLGPLNGENRLIVKRGLKRLAETKSVGLKKLLQLASINATDSIDTTSIGYRIAPRINAAGRIDDPYIALSLLLQEEEGDKLDKLGRKLETINNRRQDITQEALVEATAKLEALDELPKIIIDYSPDWHVGILGLVAGKLSEKHARPAIIMQDLGETLVASARSPEFFNITDALNEHKNYLITFGGHAQAAGFNIKKENLEEFIKALTSYAEKKLKGRDLKSYLHIDCELEKEDLTLEFFDSLEILQPFGVENAKPVFIMKNLEPLFISKVGKDGGHLKFSLSIDGEAINVIAFRMGEHEDILKEFGKIDIAFHLDKNSWNNRQTIQLHALDFRKCDV